MIRLVLGDTKPDLVFEIERDGVQGTDLTDTISSVVFKLLKPSGAEVTVPLSLVSATLTKYAGSFAVGDLDESQPNDPMYGEVVVTYTDGDEQHGEEPFEVYVRAEYEDFR